MVRLRAFRKMLPAAVLVLAGQTALAAAQSPVTVKINGTTMLAGRAVLPFARRAAREPGLAEIFDNLLPPAKYPYGTYFCCLGPTIAGPNNSYGVPEESWAEAFIPSVAAKVTKIEVGVGYAVGTNSINIGLYSDSNGVPGTALVSQDVRNLPPFGSCCVTMVLKDKAGIEVSAGTRYWVVLATDSNDTDFLGGWNEDDPDQVTKIDQAENLGSGWQAGGIAPGVALAVWGK